MKNFFGNIIENFINSIKRFPLSVVFIIIITIIFFKINHIEHFFYDERNKLFQNLIKINLSLITTFFLSVGFYLFSKSEKHNFFKTYFFQIITIILGILFYLFYGNIFNYESFIFFIIINFGIVSFIFFAGFFSEIFSKKQNNSELYFVYLKETFGAFVLSIFIGFIVFILGIFAIKSIFSLFDLQEFLREGKTIGYFGIISCSFLAPFYGLSKLPQKNKLVLKNSIESFPLFLVKYIFIPFVSVFFVILYVYSIKVLLNFNSWPKGEVAWMVIIFSLFAYFTYLISYNSGKIEKFIGIFRKILPFVVIPQIFMLFYSIYVRIANYGLTINRYLVVIFGIVLLLASTYLIFSKRKFLAVLPFICTFFAIIISIGPWSIYSLPQKNQLNLLKNNLIKAGILSEKGEIKPLKNFEDISEDLSRNIYSEINYLCDYDDCNAIKKLFKKQFSEFKKLNKNNFSKWELKSFITENIKVKYYRDFYSENKEIIEFSKDIFPLNISNYDKIYKISITDNKIYDDGTGKTIGEKEILEIPFDLTEKILKEKDNKNFEFEFEKNGKKYKILLDNIWIYERNNKIVSHLDGFLLVR